MERWKKITNMAAVYIFLIQCRPLEPFGTAYLTGPDVNVSLLEVANTVELIKSYSALIGSFIMFISADYFLYKPNMIVVTSWCCLSYFLMTNSPSVLQIRVSSIGLGVIYSSHILGLCYLFAQLEDINQFLMGTGILMASCQLGNVVGDLLAEIIVYLTGGTYTVLPYFTAFIMIIATVWSYLLPAIEQNNDPLNVFESNEKSWLLNRSEKNMTKPDYSKFDKSSVGKKQKNVVIAAKEFWKNFKSTYSDPIMLKNSLWYSMGMAAYILFLSNINILYSYVIKKPGNNDTLLNGYAEAMVTSSGAAGAYLIGKIQLNWNTYNNLFTTFCSLLMSVLMISCYYYDHLFFIYMTCILYGLVSQGHFVVIIAEIAKHQKNQLYSMVLVFNYFGSLIIVNLISLFLIQFNFMNITIPGRFLFIGSMYALLGIVFLFLSILQGCKNKTVY